MNFTEFITKYKLNLNEQQAKAVTQTDGAILLLAVPGSGKTFTLVSRIGYMLICKKINPESILTMTYTVAATNDMRSRFSSIFGEELGEKLEFRTINALSASIINKFERYTNRRPFTLITDGDETATKIIGNIYREVTGSYASESDIKQVKTYITYFKNMMLTDDEIKNFTSYDIPIYDIYKKYVEVLTERKLMDFDDQMVFALRILNTYPAILEEVQAKYRYVCVDEAQDTSKIQHEIIKTIVGKHPNLFMVGDEDQSIYGFRAAYPDALINFKNDYDNAVTLYLEKNYRSVPAIVDVANQVIKLNKLRYDKNMTANRVENGEVRKVTVNSRFAQYDHLLEVAKNCDKETAILYRDNEHAIPVIDLLERNNIPYRVRNDDYAFFTSRIVTDVKNIINFMLNQNDDALFKQIYTKINFYMRKEQAYTIADYAHKKGISIPEAINTSLVLSSKQISQCVNIFYKIHDILKMDAQTALNEILKLGYRKYLDSNGVNTNKLDILFALSRQEKSIVGLLNRLNELHNVLKNKEFNNKTKFILSTIHSSKGLEYENVYLLDLIDGIFPNEIKQSLSNAEKLKLEEEERRVFYVGITRAKNTLTVFENKFIDSTYVIDLFPKKPNVSPTVLGKPASVEGGAVNLPASLSWMQVGVKVRHLNFGVGVILNIKENYVTVKFATGKIGQFAIKYMENSTILKKA